MGVENHIVDALFSGHQWLTFGFDLLALVCATAWTCRYVVRKYVEGRRDLASLRGPGGRRGVRRSR